MKINKLLAANLRGIVDRRLKNKSDFVIVVDGYEGSGKSTLSSQLCAFVAFLFDLTFTVKHICFDLKGMINTIKPLKKGHAVQVDEGVFYYKRSSMTKPNRVLNALFMRYRKKCLFWVICIPKFTDLDSYMRGHRLGALIHIKERGSFEFYSRKRAMLIAKADGDYNVSQPNFVGGFDDWMGCDKEEYEELKDKSLQVFIESELAEME